MIKENKIPKHWKMASLVDDLPFIKTGVLEYEGIKKYYSTGSIKSDSMIDEGEYSFNTKPSRANRIGKKGDVLQARMKNTQKAVLINSNLEEQLFSTGFFQIRGIENMLCSKYIYYYLTSSIFNQIKDELCSGSTQSALNDENAKKIFIPIAPFHEQKIIISKIEELFSELDKAIEDLKTTRLQLKTYRQSVLKWAFEGKLTNKKVKDGELPKKWKWVKLKEVAKDISDGDHQAPPKAITGIPFITISNVNKSNNQIDFANTFKVSTDYYSGLKQNRKPQKGDVLYTVTGSFGIPILIDYEKDFCFQRHIGLVRPLNTISQKWIFYLLQSPQVFSQAKETATGTAQKTVALGSLRNFDIAYCHYDEQIIIVQEIESRLSIADKMEESISFSLIQAEALKQSILNKAFSGELVNKVTDGESGSQLIEKIKEIKVKLLKEEKDRLKLILNKNKKMPEKAKTITEILTESSKPVASKILWQSSIYKNDIDSFYAQLKVLIVEGKIRETVRDGKETFIELIEN